MPSAHSSGPVLKVLIFDDELHAKAPQYRVPCIDLQIYENADDATQHVHRERPHVVLMDYSMQGDKNGADALAALHALRAHHALPLRLIAISGSTESNRQMLAVGADDAVPKTHVRAYLSRLAERAGHTPHLSSPKGRL